MKNLFSEIILFFKRGGGELLLKAGILSAGWLLLPFWLFAVVALGFYFFPFFPFFQPFRLELPYLVTLFLAAVISPNIWTAAFLGILFFLILGIKELILISRVSAYETLIYFLFSAIFLNYFSRFGSGENLAGVLWALAIAFLFLFLLRGVNPQSDRGEAGRKETLAAGLMAFLVWQAILVAAFLPVNFFYQTAVTLLLAVIFAGLFLKYKENKLDRQTLLVSFSVFFALSVFILASAQWGLGK
jgi:hypothetical protein